MWNLCCSSNVKKQHNSHGFTRYHLTSFLPWFFLWLTLRLLFTVKIVNYENISLLKVEDCNQSVMLIIY